MDNAPSTLGQFIQRELLPQCVLREQELLAQIEAEAAALVIAPATHEARKPHQNTLAKARKHYDRLNEARELMAQLLTKAVNTSWQGDLSRTCDHCTDVDTCDLIIQLQQKMRSCGL